MGFQAEAFWQDQDLVADPGQELVALKGLDGVQWATLLFTIIERARMI